MKRMKDDDNDGAQAIIISKYFLHVNNLYTVRSRVCSWVNSLVNPFLFLQVFLYFKILLIFQF